MSSLSPYNSGPGWASWPCHAVSALPRDHGGSKRELGGATLGGSGGAICSELWPGPALPAPAPIHPEPDPNSFSLLLLLRSPF